MKNQASQKKNFKETEIKNRYDYQEPEILHKISKDDPDRFWDGETIRED